MMMWLQMSRGSPLFWLQILFFCWLHENIYPVKYEVQPSFALACIHTCIHVWYVLAHIKHLCTRTHVCIQTMHTHTHTHIHANHVHTYAIRKYTQNANTHTPHTPSHTHTHTASCTPKWRLISRIQNCDHVMKTLYTLRNVHEQQLHKVHFACLRLRL